MEKRNKSKVCRHRIRSNMKAIIDKESWEDARKAAQDRLKDAEMIRLQSEMLLKRAEKELKKLEKKNVPEYVK